MNITEVKQILSQGEGRLIEFKRCRNSLPSSLYETIVSFSNTDGGTIILGAENDGTISGIDSNYIPQIITDLATALNSPDCVTPSLYLTPIEMAFTEGKY
ncbi:MAG: putative DNA binding domain-containing protein [Melioribacteraceae bacterium]|nr:putative DNA binding domain-containing protein [Melioribacteraceae bacterium]